MNAQRRPSRARSRQLTWTSRAALTMAALSTVVALVGGGCGSESSLVGGGCASGLTECNLECVDLLTDERHCGECNHACGPVEVCLGGQCVAADGSFDASAGDGSRDGSGSDARENFDVGTGDGSGDGSGGDGSTIDACPPPPYNTASNCGACGVVCITPNDTCKATDAGTFQCEPLCTLPQSNCFGKCVTLDDDPVNCGACGRICQSNICVGGQCQGAANGDIVFIGHDYMATPAGTAQARMLGNAVLMAPRNPVRLMVFEKWANATSAGIIKAIIANEAAIAGRTVFMTTTADENFVAADLSTAKYDVLLVPDQELAPPGALAPIGTAWNGLLSTFTTGGGVFVVLDGVAGTTQEMPQFLNATGTLTIIAHQSFSAGTLIDIKAPGDAVARGIVSTYASRDRSARISTEPNGGNVVYVATDQPTGLPNAVHKIAM